MRISLLHTYETEIRLRNPNMLQQQNEAVFLARQRMHNDKKMNPSYSCERTHGSLPDPQPSFLQVSHSISRSPL